MLPDSPDSNERQPADRPAPSDPPIAETTGGACRDEDARTCSRRGFIGKAARKLAFAAPVVLLFKPKEVVAASAGGSAITPG
jgi:hypothetical protein